MEITQDYAQTRVHELMTANGADIEKLIVVAKGKGVWLALAQLAGEDVQRQGIFTDEQLQPQ